MKFNHLNVPNHWKHEFSKYPEGFTILEALIQWVQQVDKMVDSQNNLTDRVDKHKKDFDDFIKKFDKSLQTTVTGILSEWQQSGFLNVVINEALQTQIDDVEAQLTQTIKQNPNRVSIEEFGGSPSNTDNINAIQSAFNALGNGGIVVIPKGEFITSPFEVPPNVVIEGSGQYVTVLKMKNGSNKDFITFDQARASGIYNLSIEGNKNNNLVGSGIVIKNSQQQGKDNSRNLKIEHIQIRNFPEDGIKVLFPLVWVFMLRFIKIDGCNGFGIFNNATDNSFYMIDIYGCKKGAVRDEGKNNRWIGGKWYVNGDITGQTSTSTLFTSAHRSIYVGIETQDNHGHGINVVNGRDLVFTAVISDCSGVLSNPPTNRTGIQIQGSKRISFSACNVANYLSETTQHRGVFVDGTSEDIDLGIKIASSNISIPLEINNNAKNITNGTNIPKYDFIRVFRNSAQTIVANTWVKINFDTVLNDDWLAYNTTSHVYYAKHDGIYLVNAHVQWGSQPSGNRTRMAIHRNGSVYAFIDDKVIGTTGFASSGGTIAIPLVKDQYIEIFVWSQNEVTTGTGASGVHLQVTKVQ